MKPCTAARTNFTKATTKWFVNSDKPLMYGRTAVDLISVAGSLSDACRLLDFVMLYVGETGRCPDMKHSYCCLRCMCINNLYSGLPNRLQCI